MMIRYCLTIAILLSQWLPLFSQQQTIGYQLFNHENGLLGTVYNMCQDSNGFIWLGTNNGLYQFDGTHFTHYSKNDGIDSRTIVYTHKLNDSTLLVYGKAPNSLYWIDTRPGKFRVWQKKTEEGILQLTPEVNRVLVREINRLYWIESRTKNSVVWSLEQDPFRKKLPVRYLSYSWNDSDTLVYNSKGKPLSLSRLKGVNLHNVLGIAVQGDTTSWVHTTKGFYSINGDSSRFFPLPWQGPLPRVLHYCMDSEARIWFTDVGGNLYRYSTTKNELVELSETFNLGNHQITCIYRDNSGNVWLGTGGKGLFFLPMGIVRNYSEADGLMGNEVTSLYELSESEIFVTTNIGLNLLQGDSAFIHPTAESVQSPKNTLLKKSVYRPHFGFQVFKLRDQWIYSADFVVGQPGELSWLGRDFLTISASFLDSLAGDTLVIGRWGVLSTATFDGNRLVTGKTLKGSLGKTYKLVTFKGHHWLAAAHGLYRIPFSFNTLKKVKIDKQLPYLSNTLDFKDILNQGDSILWAATSQGILKYTKGHWEHLVSAGLNNIDYRSLALDTKNRLWAASNRGLHCFEGSSSRVYGQEIGMLSSDLTKLLYSPSRNLLFAGTTEGLFSVDLNLLDQHQNKNKELFIRSLQLNDSLIINPAHTVFRHDQNNLVLNYQPRAYNGPGQVLYSYRLKGIHDRWTFSPETQARFLALEPADYHFQLRAKFPGENWGPLTSFFFTIKPPLWKTPAFVFSALAFFVLLVITAAWLWTVRVKNTERQKREQLQTVNFLEQQAISSTMNPHFIFNSLNAIQYYVSAMPNPPEAAIDYIGNFSRLIRDNMEAALSREVSLAQEIERLKTYLKLEQERLENKLEFTLEVNPEIDQQKIKIPSMLLIPFAENAIWHGIMPSHRKGEIIITLSLENGMLEISITDNGVGLNTENQRPDHISRGIDLSRKRLKLRSERNRIEVQKRENSEGTTVRIFLDLGS